MSRFTRLLPTLCLLAFLATGGHLLAQSSGSSNWPRGLLVSKDPQTGYVEAFEYIAVEPTNGYVSAYRLPGGLVQHVQTSAVVEDVRYPLSATQPVPRAQIQASLSTLESLTQRYPRYATLFATGTARLRTVPTLVPSVSTPPTTRPSSPSTLPAVASSARPLPASTSPSPGAIAILTLRNGTRYQDVTVLHADGDRFTIRHQKGITEVLFRDLPADPTSVPPTVQTLLKIYEGEVARAEAERKQAAVAVASQPWSPTTGSMPPPVDASNAPAFPPLPSSMATSSKGRNAVLPGLTVKGICIGMDGVDAARALIEQGQGKLTVEPTPIPSQHGYEVYLVSHGHKASGVIGHLSTDPQDNNVTMFRFYPALSNFLFNTADQGAEEFAQTFINAYNVPTIEPTTIGFNTRCWSHTSTEGWTLDIYTDKAVQVMRTPDRKFD